MPAKPKNKLTSIGVKEARGISFTQFAMQEGVFDFVRGASAEAGKKIAGSAPVRAVKDVVAAGQAASAEATKKQAQQLVLDAMKVVAQLGPDGERLLQQILKGQGKQGMLALQLYAQAKQHQYAAQQAQQQAPTTQQPQQATPTAPSAPAPKQNQRQNIRAAVPNAFRTERGARTHTTKSGQTLSLASFDFDIGGQDILAEGVWDFVKGAGREVGNKVANAAQQYAAKSPFAGFSDIWNAGKDASSDADAKRQAAKTAQAATAKVQAVAQQLIKAANAMLAAGLVPQAQGAK